MCDGYLWVGRGNYRFCIYDLGLFVGGIVFIDVCVFGGFFVIFDSGINDFNLM